MTYRLTIYGAIPTRKTYFTREQAVRGYAKHGTGRQVLVEVSERGLYRSLTVEERAAFVLAVGNSILARVLS